MSPYELLHRHNMIHIVYNNRIHVGGEVCGVLRRQRELMQMSTYGTRRGWVNLSVAVCLATQSLAAVSESKDPFWPDEGFSLATGRIVRGPQDMVGKTLGDFPQWFHIGNHGSSVMIDADAAPGSYSVQWLVNKPEGIEAAQASAKLYKTNGNQGNSIQARGSSDGEWMTAGNSKAWEWQQVSGDAWPLAADEPLDVRWTFSKPHKGDTWRVGLEALHVGVTDPAAALDRFRQPMAKGLPLRVDPRTAKKPWRSKLQISNGMILKDDKPFFPIGLIRGFGNDSTLAQVKAIGCNATDMDIGWFVTAGPGPVGEERFSGWRHHVRQAAEWDMVAFPVLVGHYVPGWFRQQYPSKDNWPLGSDGEMSGHWMAYSLHYRPLREQIVHFWRAAAKVIAQEPNVMSVQFWNEPSYGGAWNLPKQYADYQPYAIDDYRQHLKEKYTSLDALSKAHEVDYASFEAVQPPRAPEEMSRAAWLDWMEYGQQYFAGFFEWERGVLREAAPGLRLANKKQTNPWDNSTASSGTNWHLMTSSEEIFGLNIYCSSVYRIRNIMDAARSYANGKPVVIFEVNAMPPNAEARTLDNVRCQLWSYILGGTDGMLIYALTGGDAHDLTLDKAVKPEARPEYVRFISGVADHQRQFASPHVPARIAVLYSTTAALQYTHNLIPRHFMGAFNLFRNSHYQVDALPEERCTGPELAKYELVVLPSYCVLKGQAIEALNAYAQSGGKLMAFAKSLATDEYLNPIAPPTCLSIKERKRPVGDRADQRITWVAEELAEYVEGEPAVGGLELVSQIEMAGRRIIQGEALETRDEGEVLARNRDSFPTILLAPGGNVVYCAFESEDYSAPLRGLIEGVTREKLKIAQHVRFLRDGLVEPGVMTSLRQDYNDADLRYLIAINTLRHPRTLEVQIEPGWSIERELFHDLKVDGDQQLRVPKREVFLFELRRK